MDLSFSIHEGMTTFPVHWHPMVEISQMGRHGIEDRETRKLVLGTHTGTHMDAPRHFIPGGSTIDQVPTDLLYGEAHLLNFVNLAPGTEVSRGMMLEALGNLLPRRVVLRYGWSEHWNTLRYYQDHPFLSPEAASLLVERGIRLVAMDTPMPDNPRHGRGHDPDSPIHKILLGAGVFLVEYLNNLELLNRSRFDLIVAPLNITGADGAPARVLAIEEQ